MMRARVGEVTRKKKGRQKPARVLSGRRAQLQRR
jgi:hypothetical protein